jgi:hypothetical protein
MKLLEVQNQVQLYDGLMEAVILSGRLAAGLKYDSRTILSTVRPILVLPAMQRRWLSLYRFVVPMMHGLAADAARSRAVTAIG